MKGNKMEKVSERKESEFTNREFSVRPITQKQGSPCLELVIQRDRLDNSTEEEEEEEEGQETKEGSRTRKQKRNIKSRQEEIRESKADLKHQAEDFLYFLN